MGLDCSIGFGEVYNYRWVFGCRCRVHGAVVGFLTPYVDRWGHSRNKCKVSQIGSSLLCCDAGGCLQRKWLGVVKPLLPFAPSMENVSSTPWLTRLNVRIIFGWFHAFFAGV